MSNRNTKAELLTSAPILANPCYVQPFLSLHNEDCLETMRRIETGSVDLMITDPPYGITQNDWDIVPNFDLMWLEWERIVKPNGAFIFTAQQPFTSQLVNSRLDYFKYELIWLKNKAVGFLDAGNKPLKEHENIVVFYRKLPTYNPQFTFDKPYDKGVVDRMKTSKGNYGKTNISKSSSKDGKRFPKSVIHFGCEQRTDHPTQKPIDLFRYLINTYSNEGDLVFDGYSGSGTTAHACIKEGRKFIGSELNKEYYEKSVKRLHNAISQPEMFVGSGL